MSNNLTGAGRRGFFGFRITLFLVFFPSVSSLVAVSPRREHGYVKKGT